MHRNMSIDLPLKVATLDIAINAPHPIELCTNSIFYFKVSVLSPSFHSLLHDNFCSACILSNETVNIWSHLLGLIYFTLLQFNDNLYFLPDHGSTFGDHMTFTAMNLCFQVCTLAVE